MSKSYLIIKLSSLGDVIQSLCVSAYLKDKNPTCKVTWLVDERFEELVRACPSVDQVLVVSANQLKLGLKKAWGFTIKAKNLLRKTCFDVAFDLQGNSKSALFTLLAKAKIKVGFSKKCVSEWPNLLVTNRKYTVDFNICRSKQYLQLPQKFFQDESLFVPQKLLLNIPSNQTLAMQCFLEQKALDSNMLIMVCPHSNWESKKLSLELLKELLHELKTKFSASFLFIYGNQEERRFSEKLKDEFKHCSAATGGLSIPIWYFLMTRVHLVLSMDSSALHLADLANTPTFSFFGPSNPMAFAPKGKIHAHIQGFCPYGQTFQTRCRYLRSCHDHPCISQFKREDIIKACSEHIYKNLHLATQSTS